MHGRAFEHAHTYHFRFYKTVLHELWQQHTAVSLDADDQQVIHNHTKAPPKNRSVAKFDGGKHATNPLQLIDQSLPQQKISAKVKAKTNALEDDFTSRVLAICYTGCGLAVGYAARDIQPETVDEELQVC